MQVDLPTLYVVTVFVAVVAGCLLMFSWWRDRSTNTLALWGTGYLVGSLGMGLIAARGQVSPFWSIEMGNGLAMLAYGLMWSGARSFEGRSIGLWTAAGAIVWVVLCQFDAFMESMYLRIIVFSAMVAAYSLLTASEYGRAQERDLLSRWPAIILLLAHACLFMIRIPLVEFLPVPGGTLSASADWLPVGVFALLLHHFCMAFLVVNMTKERVELRHRQAAQIDPLTGISNRRAFFEQGERILQRMTAEDRDVALLLLDLDLFKQINDNYGHQTGDRVLCVFSQIARSSLRPQDLFGRLGGEEFACLLPDATPAVAAQVAERIRAHFEGRPLDLAMRKSGSTVSIGIASSADLGEDLAAMLAAADRALYEAKANGRNRIEVAHPFPTAKVVPAQAAVG